MLALLDLDPNIVKPGWTPAIITLILAAAMVLLFISLRRQFRRIDVTQSQSQSQSQTPSPAAVTDLEASPKPTTEA